MTQNKDERKRPQLRLVVNNVEKRNPRSADKEEDFIPLEELVAKRELLRPQFYQDMDCWQTKAYEALEQFLAFREWPYGLDPQGRLVILPAGVVCPEAAECGGSPQDELILFLSEDAAGKGLCLSLEMMLPYWSEDEEVMEDALLYAPVFQYGTLFLEESRQDELLDLIYRLGFPLYPPAPTEQLLDRLFAIAAYELRETLRSLAEYPGS
jgi:hypothetical protein